MAEAIEIAVKVVILFMMVGTACVLIFAAWCYIFDWWYSRFEEPEQYPDEREEYDPYYYQ